MYLFCWRISLELHIVEKKKVEMSFLDAMVLIYVITFVCKKFDFFVKSAMIVYSPSLMVQCSHLLVLLVM